MFGQPLRLLHLKKAVAIIKHLYVVVVLNHSGLEGGKEQKTLFLLLLCDLCERVVLAQAISSALVRQTVRDKMKSCTKTI